MVLLVLMLLPAHSLATNWVAFSDRVPAQWQTRFYIVHLIGSTMGATSALLTTHTFGWEVKPRKFGLAVARVSDQLADRWHTQTPLTSSPSSCQQNIHFSFFSFSRNCHQQKWPLNSASFILLSFASIHYSIPLFCCLDPFERPYFTRQQATAAAVESNFGCDDWCPSGNSSCTQTRKLTVVRLTAANQLYWFQVQF